MAADAAAYLKMLDEGSLDRCGVTLSAGKAVGAPFMGVATTLVLSEVLRLLHGGDLHRLIDMNLVDLAYFRTVPQLARLFKPQPWIRRSGSDAAATRLLTRTMPRLRSRSVRRPPSKPAS